jgi:hypothetical protein
MTALAYAPPATPSRQVRPAPRATHPRAATTPVPKLRYIVVVLTGIFAILGIQLLLSIAVSGGAYEIAALKGETRKSQQELQIVAEDISQLTAPGTLAGLATAMGMVADNNPAYLRLSDGQVIGEAKPAPAESGVTVYPVTAGGESQEPSAIVESVRNAVTLQLALTEESEIDSSLETSQPSAPTATVVSQPLEQPAVKFGGSLPSPVTR